MYRKDTFITLKSLVIYPLTRVVFNSCKLLFIIDHHT